MRNSQSTLARRPPIWQSGLILAALAALCTILVALTHRYTAPLIHANDQAFLEQSLKPVLGGIEYETELTRSVLTIPAPHDLPGTEAAVIYRIFADGEPAAALFIVSARDGFAGPIKLLIGVRIDGSVTAVRILQHKETPGLGDMIDSSKSDWLQQFESTSLISPVEASWKIKRDGGEFDQLTGASVTPRAVISAIKETLIYFDSNHDFVFSAVESDLEYPQ
jgi:electron transport complex protein RnfG